MQPSASVIWCSDCISDLVQPPGSAMPSGPRLSPCPDTPASLRGTTNARLGGDRADRRDHRSAVSGRGTGRPDHAASMPEGAPHRRARRLSQPRRRRADTSGVRSGPLGSWPHRGCRGPGSSGCTGARVGHEYGSGLGADPGGCSKPPLALARSRGGISGMPRGQCAGPRFAGAQSSHADHPHRPAATGPP
jgi:hypothetical protein